MDRQVPPTSTAKANRISPRFRVDLVGTYHRGIQVGICWESLTKDSKTSCWRNTNYKAGESGEINVLSLGLIPYENIDNVDWEGDEFYGYPHIYCFFPFRKEPYEHVGYYTEKTPPNGLPFYSEVAQYNDVRRLSKKRGIVS